MARDRLNVRDSAHAEILNVEDALYPCPKCGKGGTPAPALKCKSCGQNIPHNDMHCPKCGHRYPKGSVPVMTYICRVCGKPGVTDHYIEESSKRVHPECLKPPTVN